jgi:hypothetical protein
MKSDHISLPKAVMPAADLVMRPVLGTDPNGVPMLAGVASTAILDLAQVPPVVGLIAVCRDMPDRVVVMGYVDAAQARAVATVQAKTDADGWLVIGTGRAQIRLHPDGRMRIKAEDITLDSAGRLGLRGAWIDLN